MIVANAWIGLVFFCGLMLAIVCYIAWCKKQWFYAVTCTISSIICIMSVVIMPLTGSAAKELPPDAKYDVYLPQDGYFVILDRGNTDKRVTPTLVKLNPKRPTNRRIWSSSLVPTKVGQARKLPSISTIRFQNRPKFYSGRFFSFKDCFLFDKFRVAMTNC